MNKMKSLTSIWYNIELTVLRSSLLFGRHLQRGRQSGLEESHPFVSADLLILQLLLQLDVEQVCILKLLVQIFTLLQNTESLEKSKLNFLHKITNALLN